MRNKAHYGIPGLCLRTALGILCAALLCGTTYGQNRGGSGLNGGPCVVTELRLRIVTGGDDLRGGQDIPAAVRRWPRTSTRATTGRTIA